MNRNRTILPQEFQEIEQYLLKEMSEEQMQSFAKRLDSDQELHEKIHTVRLVIAGIQENQLVRELENFHDGMKIPSKNITTKKNLFNLKNILLAASVIIIASMGIFLFYYMPGKEERLYTEFYKPDTGLISSMSSSDEYVFDRAMIDYKTGNYDAAIHSWDSLLTEKPGNDTLQFFIASAYLAMDHYNKAIAHFKEVVSQTNSNFFEDANWYLGLAFLKVDKKDKAIPFIEKSNHPQKDKLLDKLRK